MQKQTVSQTDKRLNRNMSWSNSNLLLPWPEEMGSLSAVRHYQTLTAFWLFYSLW